MARVSRYQEKNAAPKSAASISSMLTAEWLCAVREVHLAVPAVERGRTRSLATSLYPMPSVAGNRPFGTSQGNPFTGNLTAPVRLPGGALIRIR